jgi:hypothetical protein
LSTLKSWVHCWTAMAVFVLSVPAAGAPRSEDSAPKVEAPPAARGAALLVRWRNQRFAPDAAPASLAAPTRATIAALGPLAEELVYRIDVSKCGRIVCVTDAAESSVHGAETVLRSVLERFDALFPGAGPGRVVVLARTRNAGDAEAFAALTPPPDQGLVSTLDGAPFRVAAWTVDEAAAGRRAAEARLVCATTHTLLADRYGDLPAWFTRGVALHVEELVTGRFASVDPDTTARHWRAALKRKFAADDIHLDLVTLGVRPEVCQRRSAGEPAPTDDEQALQEAWALVAALATQPGPAGLGPIAVDLSRESAREVEGRKGQDAHAETDAASQVRILEQHRGPGVLALVEASLAHGREKLEAAAKNR